MSLTFRAIGSRESIRYMAVKYKVLFVQDLQTDTVKWVSLFSSWQKVFDI